MLMNTARARTLMEADGVDGIISATLESNFYLSGIWQHGQEVFPRDGEAYTVATADNPAGGAVVCSIGAADLALCGYDSLSGVYTFGTFFRDFIPGTSLTPGEQRVLDITEAHSTDSGVLDALAAALHALGLASARVAVEETGPNRQLIAQLSERLPDATFVPGRTLLRRIRMVKTEGERELMLGALRATEAAMRAAIGAAREGVTERELQLIFERTILDQDAHPSFTLLRFGRGLALGQIPAGEVPLHRGDTIFFDVGCNFGGYKSDIGRLVSFGEPSEQQQMLYAATRAGQQTAIDMMRPGAIPQEIFAAAVATVRDNGIPTYQRQHTGHGIGIETYDMPIIQPGSDTPLEAGMIFEIETPYYRLGVGGSFIEDTVLVTDHGAQILTELSRDFLVIDG
jgi:Xaa-Pro dipeptidase